MTLSKYTNILPLACQNVLHVTFLIFLFLSMLLPLTRKEKNLNVIVTCKSYHLTIKHLHVKQRTHLTVSPVFFVVFYARKTLYAAFMSRSPETLSFGITNVLNACANNNFHNIQKVLKSNKAVNWQASIDYDPWNLYGLQAKSA